MNTISFKEIYKRMKTYFICRIVILLLLIVPYNNVYAQNTVGTIINAPTSSDGYTLFEFMGDTSVYLIDNCGQVIHQWNSEFTAGTSVYMLEDGSIMRAGRTPTSSFNVGGQGGVIEKIDWDGNLEWQYFYSDSLKSLHHDIAVMPNGNVLAIAFELKSKEESIAAGRDSLMIIDNKLWPEKIIELQPFGLNGAVLKWEWHMWDHLIQDFDNTKENFGEVEAHPELFNLNYTTDSIADWAHANSIAYNSNLDQIALSLNSFNEFIIIDHSTTTEEAASHNGGTQGKGGDILYRYGNPITYGHGDSTDQVNFSQHHVDWIADGLTDAGKIMFYNNGKGRPEGDYSSIDIITPLINTDGNYVIESDTTFGPDGPEWQYFAPVLTDLFSPIISGAQRLENGNTLICEGKEGRIFEIEALTEEIVWEYYSPLTNGGILSQGDSVSGNRNIFRAIKYLPTYPAFDGKDLSPGMPLELNPNIEECLDASYIQVDEENFNIYPIPTTDILNIVQSTDLSKELVEIRDLNGKIVFQKKFSKSLDISLLEQGVYIIKIGHLSRKLIKN